MANRHSTVLILLFTLLFSKISFDQTIKISGAVISNENEQIVGASIMLLNAKDSILKTYALTNKNGNFTLSKIKPGNYLLKVSFIGYSLFEHHLNITKKSEDLNLGAIKLAPNLLNTIVVKSQYIPVQMKGDSLMFDPRAFEIKKYDMVESLLSQLPGIEISIEGTILFHGKKVNQILIDGDIFFGDDPKIASKNLSAESIGKIEIFDKKSESSNFTGIDDGTESLTINLKLKDNYKKGYFGNLLFAGGLQYPLSDIIRYKSKGNINYFKNKWRVSALAMTNNINETDFDLSNGSNIIGDAKNSLNNRKSGNGFMKSYGTGFNISYIPSKSTMFSSSIFLKNTNSINDKITFRETYFSDSILYTNEVQSETNSTIDNTGSVNFRKTFNTSHFLTINSSFSWNTTQNKTKNNIENLSQNQILTSYFKTDLARENTRYFVRTRLKYIKNFEKKGRNTGLNLTYNVSNDDSNSSLYFTNGLLKEGISTESFTNQLQNGLVNTNSFEADLVWSEPILPKQTFKVNLIRKVNQENRLKTVFDQFEESSVLNQLLSANSDYQQASSIINLDHKFQGKSLRTTIGASLEHLNLSSHNNFINPKSFNFILPHVRIVWKRNLKTSIRLNYRTNYSAPSLFQLQPLPNNTNPSQIILGNPNLSPEYSHDLRLAYRTFNTNKNSFFSASVSSKIINNNIINSQTINSFYVAEIIPENLGKEISVTSNLSYGTSIPALAIKFRCSNMTRISNGLVNLNSTQDKYTNYIFSPSLAIDNSEKKILDAQTGIAYSYSINTYKNNLLFNNNYKNWNYYLALNFKLKERWLLSAYASHIFFPNLVKNQNLTLLNLSIGYNLLNAKNLQIYANGKDLLNQNTGISQNYFQNIYEESITKNLGRYITLGIKYVLKP